MNVIGISNITPPLGLEIVGNYIEPRSDYIHDPVNVRRASPELLANMEQVENRALEAEPLFHPLEKIYLDRVRMLEREWPDQFNIVLQTFRVGELGIAAIPFEVFAETGLEIKDRSPFADNFTIGWANG